MEWELSVLILITGFSFGVGHSRGTIASLIGWDKEQIRPCFQGLILRSWILEVIPQAQQQTLEKGASRNAWR
jgi:hypothetical protein